MLILPLCFQTGFLLPSLYYCSIVMCCCLVLINLDQKDVNITKDCDRKWTGKSIDDVRLYIRISRRYLIFYLLIIIGGMSPHSFMFILLLRMCHVTNQFLFSFKEKISSQSLFRFKTLKSVLVIFKIFTLCAKEEIITKILDHSINYHNNISIQDITIWLIYLNMSVFLLFIFFPHMYFINFIVFFICHFCHGFVLFFLSLGT